MFVNPECQAKLLEAEPQLATRFRQLNCFYRPNAHCDIFDSALKLCVADMVGWGFEVKETRISAPDGRVLWPK